ncbi:hypothetical protein QAD02_003259 [Eretmocerus hayati]|uniref:Uncharacterized protein n=1 Tax=Eretmocerus hayati TaxID=131215 RepID=A0ACC2NR21_9HYME|nr:hypothetical protein QAD02_003259 [Eretmocerus hayati]
MGAIHIDKATEDDLSSLGSTGDAMDLETEMKLLNEADKARKEGMSNTSKEALDRKSLSRKRYRGTVRYLEKMSKKNDDELSEKERKYIEINKKAVARFEQQASSRPLETIKEEAAANEAATPSKIKRKRLQRSNATRPLPSPIQPAVQTPTTGKSAKRVRSAEEEANAAKKAKPSTSFESPQECQIAIIDRSDPDGRMTAERWLMVESRILVAIAGGPEDGSDDGVEFDGAVWQKGVKVVGCSNRKSHDFLVQVVGNCGELWPGAKLEVIPRSVLPLRQLTSLWIPPPIPGEEDTILKIIERQNKGLKARGWKVISSAPSKSGNGKDFGIAVDAESLEKLKETSGSIKFGLGALKMRLPNVKDKDKGTNPEAASGAN